MRANEAYHYDLFISAAASGRQAQLETRTAGKADRVATVTIPTGAVTLGVEAYPDHYAFAVTDAAGAVHTLGTAPTAPLSSEVAGGFTGVYFGMFATTQRGSAMPSADFDWFDYRPIPND